MEAQGFVVTHSLILILITWTFISPQGCIELLARHKIPIEGKRAVVLGRSNIVGLPAALLLNNRDATVTVVHSRTPDAQKLCAGESVHN